MKITVQKSVLALGLVVPGTSVLDMNCQLVDDFMCEMLGNEWRCVASGIVQIPVDESGDRSIAELVLWWSKEDQ